MCTTSRFFFVMSVVLLVGAAIPVTQAAVDLVPPDAPTSTASGPVRLTLSGPALYTTTEAEVTLAGTVSNYRSGQDIVLVVGEVRHMKGATGQCWDI